jgi:hypothetical protein
LLVELLELRGACAVRQVGGRFDLLGDEGEQVR